MLIQFSDIDPCTLYLDLFFRDIYPMQIGMKNKTKDFIKLFCVFIYRFSPLSIHLVIIRKSQERFLTS